MANTNTTKHKHMTLEDRNEIQDCLDHGMTFKAIAKRIGKDQTTISKEVKKHLDVRADSWECSNSNGDVAVVEACPALLKAPFVCNPCRKRHARCKYRKQFYHARKAQQAYETLRAEAREGLPLTKESFYEIDRMISEGIKRGQRLYHIIQTKNLGVSKSTVYRHLKKGYLSVSPIDFPRVVKFKPRKQQPSAYVPKAAKIGRTYDDFLTYTAAHSISSWVEMDTVIGRIGGKVIATFDFTFCNFMFGRLLESKTALEVTQKLKKLKAELAAKQCPFGSVFPVILTDNGGEFANVSTIENDLYGERETRLFFCDPNRSYQKPHVEKNHTIFRDIAPKGTCFDAFSQETVNLIFSHVNNIKRKSLNGKSPLEAFSFIFGNVVAEVLGIEYIPPEHVIQSPTLLRKA
ncbi:MAG: IS30 family transposase [Clostridiales bacterium]|jgi:IS30 family transposase|nr:IS30 family transposase [Clostridiales bacterium]